ncbi:hypothetical protein [Streptomyces sp. NPDC006879]|uniref:hypothetical protein n=1 Tax=Streptomyces sp. NPDC006879 TaxID=3364767 RepID=UPI0036CDAFEA
MATGKGAEPAKESGAGSGGAGSDVDSVVPDIAALSPEAVAKLPDSVLGEALRRIFRSGDEGEAFVTGHKESA